jgi:GT2 family glycosyltransferase
MITIIITTYYQPEALDLCLESIVKTQKHKNQILVIENGFYEKNIPVFEKYKEYIDVIPFKENVGMNRTLNLGISNAYFDKVFLATLFSNSTKASILNPSIFLPKSLIINCLNMLG